MQKLIVSPHSGTTVEDERIDTAVGEHQNHCEVVEPANEAMFVLRNEKVYFTVTIFLKTGIKTEVVLVVKRNQERAPINLQTQINKSGKVYKVYFKVH